MRSARSFKRGGLEGMVSGGKIGEWGSDKEVNGSSDMSGKIGTGDLEKEVEGNSKGVMNGKIFSLKTISLEMKVSL